MPFAYYLSELKFSDDRSVQLSPGEIVVVVGPNNAGKTATLREIVTLIDAPHGVNANCKVLKLASIELTNDAETLRQWLETLEPVPTDSDQVSRMGMTMRADVLLNAARDRDYVRRALRAYCVYYVTTESRLQITKEVTNINFRTHAKGHPFHYLYDDAELEYEISAVFSKAFGTDLIVNRTAGSVITLHVGRRPESATEYNVTGEFRNYLASLPVLEAQGDGMRAFVGCLMWIVVAKYPIMLLDEPEAFLHPPQARLLGRTLAKRTDADRQIIIATHSGDFLRGVLDANPTNLRIIRISRDGTINRVRELQPAEVAALWTDSLLRQSNVLDGLFHSTVVLCEADADCQFYSAVASALAESEAERSQPDALFIHCGGKGRMPRVVNALAALGVPLCVIADFDVLRDESPLRQIYEGLGGDWNNIRDDWRVVRDAVSARRAQLEANDLRRQIDEALAAVTGPVVPDDVLSKIRDAAKKASAWAYAKASGHSFIPAGMPFAAYQRLSERLASQNLRVVPVGELESFCKTVALHGPAWVLEVGKRNLATDAELSDAREFVEQIFWPPP